LIIDIVFEQHFRDRALVEKLGLKLLGVLDAHCHGDHVTGARLIEQATGDGSKIQRVSAEPDRFYCAPGT
jgi:glyoxylase-like metal-dependent hydrolase (beta-lactamase superfamily II)